MPQVILQLQRQPVARALPERPAKTLGKHLRNWPALGQNDFDMRLRYADSAREVSNGNLVVRKDILAQNFARMRRLTVGQEMGGFENRVAHVAFSMGPDTVKLSRRLQWRRADKIAPAAPFDGVVVTYQRQNAERQLNDWLWRRR